MSHCRVDVLPPFLVDFSMGSVQRKVGKAYPSPKGPNHLAFDMVVGATCEVGNAPRTLALPRPSRDDPSQGSWLPRSDET